MTVLLQKEIENPAKFGKLNQSSLIQAFYSKCTVPVRPSFEKLQWWDSTPSHTEFLLWCDILSMSVLPSAWQFNQLLSTETHFFSLCRSIVSYYGAVICLNVAHASRKNSVLLHDKKSLRSNKSCISLSWRLCESLAILKNCQDNCRDLRHSIPVVGLPIGSFFVKP